MDELCTWFEIIRSQLPQTYEMHLGAAGHTIVISPPMCPPVRFAAADLCGRTPLEVMAALRRRMSSASAAGRRVA